MKPQDEAVELFRYMEKRGLKPSARRVAAALRAMKIPCDDHLVRKWLAPFQTAVNLSSTAGATAAQEHDSPHPAPPNHPRLRARDNCIPLPIDDSLRSSSRPEKPERARRVRQVPLGFDRELFAKRDAILKAAWERIQPYIGRATTFSAWKARNSTVAATLAEKNIAPEHIVRAWDLATAERGEPLRELFMVQRFIERAAALAAQRRLEVAK